MTKVEIMSELRSILILVIILSVIIVPIVISKVKKNKALKAEREEEARKQKAEEERLKRVERIKRETAVFYSTQKRFEPSEEVVNYVEDFMAKEEELEKDEKEKEIEEEKNKPYEDAVYITQLYDFNVSQSNKKYLKIDKYHDFIPIDRGENYYIQEMEELDFAKFWKDHVGRFAYKPDFIFGETNESIIKKVKKSITDRRDMFHEKNTVEAQYMCVCDFGKDTLLITHKGTIYKIRFSKERPDKKIKKRYFSGMEDYYIEDCFGIRIHVN